MGPKCYAVQCIVNAEENLQNCRARVPWDFVTLPDEDWATAIGNMHKKFGKDCVCGSGDILADRHIDVCMRTHKHTQTCSLQYFATAPTG